MTTKERVQSPTEGRMNEDIQQLKPLKKNSDDWGLTMSQAKEQVTFSIDIAALLTAALVILKLMGKISISWFWVFLPVWISFAVVAIVVVVLLVVLGIATLFKL